MMDLERGQISDETSANSWIPSQISSNERINVSERNQSVYYKEKREKRKKDEESDAGRDNTRK